MLDRLETADLAAERHAFQCIVTAHLQRAIRAADLLEGDQNGRTIKQDLEVRPAFAALSEPFGGGIVEGEMRLPAGRIDRVDGAAGNGVLRQIDEHEAKRVAFLRQHDCYVGDIAVEDRRLTSIQHAVGEGGPDRLLRQPLPFGGGEAADRRAGGDLWQPFALLLRVAERLDGLGRKVDRREDRQRRKGAAKLLRDGAELEIAKAETAMLLRNRDPEKAHFGNAVP